MDSLGYSLLIEATRGPIVESVHYGALAVVDANGQLIASVGAPEKVANLRSSSKPFQTLPLVEMGGVEAFGLTDRELALTCASHSGTDDHVSVLRSIHQKVQITEANLQCGVHWPIDEETTLAMRARGEEPTPYRHNCSGKHSGMLAQCQLRELPMDDYLNPEHLIQKNIIQTFAEMCDLQAPDVLIGIDGCSAPTFAVPLRAAALAYARLADPRHMPEPRAASLRHIFKAMGAHPDMVAGPHRFDTAIMRVTQGRIVAKGGAEGYQGMCIAPGVISPDSPGIGITIKIADGDHGDRARVTAAMAVLRQLGALSPAEIEQMAAFDTRPLYNWRHIEIGQIRPAFNLKRHDR